MAARRYANGTATSLSVPAAPAATRAGAVRLHPADLQALGEVVAASAGGVTINAQSGASAQELMVEAGWLLSTRRLR